MFNKILEKNKYSIDQISPFRSHKKGFGLLEVLISGTIIIVIAGAVVFLGKSSMRNSEYLQQRAQAMYLAQQGIELVRQMRDTNWIDGNSSTGWKSIKWDGTKLIDVTLDQDYSLNYNLTAKKYNGLVAYGPSVDQTTLGGNNLIFNRKIRIAKIENANSLIVNNSTDSTKTYPETNAFKVIVEISWDSPLGAKTISASEVLTNWRPNF